MKVHTENTLFQNTHVYKNNYYDLEINRAERDNFDVL